jgi:hypothetical protein
LRCAEGAERVVDMLLRAMITVRAGKPAIADALQGLGVAVSVVGAVVLWSAQDAVRVAHVVGLRALGAIGSLKPGQAVADTRLRVTHAVIVTMMVGVAL